MSSLAVADTTTDLVRLRRWALAHLAGVGASDADRSTWLGQLDAETWRLFFMFERCASPLIDSMMHDGSHRIVPASVVTIIRREAARETESVLRAERDAKWIAAFAEGHQIRPIALKGLLPALAEANPPLHLFDLDILATESDAQLLGAHLASGGFSAAADNEIHHVYFNPPPGHLPVEIHRTVFSSGAELSKEAWQRTTPVLGVPGMFRLSYADQMLHVLYHSIVQHTDRHIRIRDLLLIVWLKSQMDKEDDRILNSLLESSPDGARFRNLMTFAERVGSRGEPAAASIKDPYEDDAILFFAATLLAKDSALWSGGPPLAWQGAAIVAAGRGSVTDVTRSAAKNPVTGIQAFSKLQRKTPAAGQAITRVGRAALYFTSATLGSPRLLAIRREVMRRLSVPLSSE